MAKSTFVGGVHPYEGKELTKDKPIKDVLPQGDLVYPLSQHIGAPAVPIVKKGDHVLRGQKIAEAGGFVSAPIYASVSGTVKNIEVDGLFVAIGRKPDTEILNGKITLDNNGYIITDEKMRTNIKGVFACGDVRSKQLRQIVTACSDGAIASISAFEYIRGG